MNVQCSFEVSLYHSLLNTNKAHYQGGDRKKKYNSITLYFKVF